MRGIGWALALVLFATACGSDDDGGGAAGAGGASADAGDGAAGSGGACEAGLTECDGTCVNLNLDPMHCGRCNFACPPSPEHGVIECAGFVAPGACTLECEPGYQDEGWNCVPVQ